MALPLSPEVALSPQLRAVLAQATNMAFEARREPCSTDLLVAMYMTPNGAVHLLKDHHVYMTALLRSTPGEREDATRTLPRLADRCFRLADCTHAEGLHSLHLLAALLCESNTDAYRRLTGLNVQLGPLRARVMSYATGSRTITSRFAEGVPEPADFLDMHPDQVVMVSAGVQASARAGSRQLDLHPGLGVQPITGAFARLAPEQIDHSLRASSTLTKSNGRRVAQVRTPSGAHTPVPAQMSWRDDLNSPVHPALRESWLRTTPTGEFAAVPGPASETPSGGVRGLDTPSEGTRRAVVRRTSPQGMPAITAEQAAEARDRGAEATLDPDRHGPPPSEADMTLAERFAKRKREARERRRHLVRHAAEAPSTAPAPAEAPSRPSAPPPLQRQEARSADETPARVTPPAPPKAAPRQAPVDDAPRAAEAPAAPRAEAKPPAPPAPTAPEEHHERDEAIQDARQATRSLAARLFARKKRDAEQIEAERPEREALISGRARRSREDLIAQYTLDPDLYPTLARLGRNLTEAAARGEIDRVVGRASEVTQLLDILGKRRVNNPLLVGDPGVGKTAIVEGLAHQLVEMAARGDRLGDRIVVELEVGRLLSGTHLRGSLSERLIALKDEVRAASGQIIVFLDEIHTWLGAGAGGDGNDAAGELKTALARGQFPCIGATTNDEFRKFIEAEPAFARRFQLVNVEEPDIETATIIANGIRPTYERHHAIAYDAEAIDAAVRLSHRHIHERRLPDKAVSVLDLAGSRVARKGRASVTREDIAHVIAEMSGVPADRLMQSDGSRFMEIEQHLGRSVVGHAHVIEAVAEILRRNYAGFRSQRPIGSMLFLGPTGVGKTELVKALADFLFHDRDAIVRLDMSEFMESHAVSRFIGAPPGYVGYEQGGQLTEAVRRRPYQVVLLDEIEKAHTDILNLLLQLFDEGRLTDGRGRTVDFSNCLIVMTSNLGAEAFEEWAERTTSRGRSIGFGAASSQPEPAREGGHIDEALTERVRDCAREHFTPELWNRIDEKLVFMPLERDEVARIAGLQLADTGRRLTEESGVTMQYDPAIIEHLIGHGGYDRLYGARPMRHTIQRLIESNLAKLILSGRLKRGDTVVVELNGTGDLCFSRLNPTTAGAEAPV